MTNPPKRINPTLNKLSIKRIPRPSITPTPTPSQTRHSPTLLALRTRKRLPPLQRRIPVTGILPLLPSGIVGSCCTTPGLLLVKPVK